MGNLLLLYLWGLAYEEYFLFSFARLTSVHNFVAYDVHREIICFHFSKKPRSMRFDTQDMGMGKLLVMELMQKAGIR